MNPVNRIGILLFLVEKIEYNVVKNICGKDDLKNLLMAFEVRQVNPLCKVYSVCNDINNIRIYANKGIEIIENFEQFERIVEHVKETNQISV